MGQARGHLGSSSKLLLNSSTKRALYVKNPAHCLHTTLTLVFSPVGIEWCYVSQLYDPQHKQMQSQDFRGRGREQVEYEGFLGWRQYYA